MTPQKLTDFLRQKPYLLTAVVFLIIAVLSYAPGTSKTYTTDGKNKGVVLGVKTALALPTPVAKPKVVAPAPVVAAKSAIVLEPASHTVLFDKNAHLRLPPASTTKIAAAAVILENRNLDEVVTVPEDLITKTPGAWMGLQPGHEVTVKDLLEGMLIRSGNDAAFTLGNLNPKGLKFFASQMNNLAKELGLANTHFTSPIGFDNPNHYSSAYDLAVLANYAMQKPKFAEIVGTREGNTNSLLGVVEGVNGVKTGYTLLARGVLVVSAERSGHKAIVVVMGSDQRDADATTLVEWAYRSINW